MASGHESSDAASSGSTFIHPRIDATFVETFGQDGQYLADAGDQTDEAIPDVTIHPVGEVRRQSGQSDDCVGVQFIEPHSISEESEYCGLRSLQRVSVRDIAIHKKSG